MDDFQIFLRLEVRELLDDLPLVLLRSGYKSDRESAMQFVRDIIGFVYQLPHVPHYPILPKFRFHFSRYYSPTHYAFFKRKSSPGTTWYIFFSIEDDWIVVKHIGTNWSDGQYIR